ncbi:hypothetical protein RND71_009651 [Anisodus tanguticus]|uniref:Uncharacterized protein n=1 Tax=Anisodus tanguticus TaxID=243964 RepID=A0AAE1SK38_9SOLA|nr:hypothetical protein RND71_009651 [Anisodus tanguticus]
MVCRQSRDYYDVMAEECKFTLVGKFIKARPQLKKIRSKFTEKRGEDHRTRPSMEKVRLEVNLTKPKVNSIFVGIKEDSSPLKGFYQGLEYENVSKYCRFCKILRHSIVQCRKVEQKEVEEKVKAEKNSKEAKANGTKDNKMDIEQGQEDELQEKSKGRTKTQETNDGKANKD